MPPVKRTFKSLAADWVIHVVRVTLVGLLLAMLYRPDGSILDTQESPDLDAVRRVIPDAASVDSEADGAGWWSVSSQTAESLGKVARTLPAASEIRGYRGVTEAILAIDDQSRITAVDVLQSRDTSEHVDAVRQDEAFWQQFVGWQITDPPKNANIDAVSGATLTSLAMARGILARLGQVPESLVFPEPLSEEERAANYARTGPLTDDIVGYQGPTELLMLVSESGLVDDIKIRKSFDNQPYVQYVVEDRYFWKLFTGRTVQELAVLDLVEQQIEGVSGATMTSQAVARTITAASQKMLVAETESQDSESTRWSPSFSGWTVSPAEFATIFWVLMSGLGSLFGWHRRKYWRAIWLVATVVVLGFWAGNLVSMSVLAGWSSEGAALTIAPGLAVLIAVALLAPPLTKSNAYCSHLCPHGAIQQLIRPQGILDRSLLSAKRRRWQLRLGMRTQKVLKMVPAVTLVVAYLLVLFRPETDLASWEPFHAYLYPIASLATILLFFLSLAVSAFVPMGYCRFGCPTGSLLDYLRRTANSRKIRVGDGGLIVLLVVAVAQRFWG